MKALRFPFQIDSHGSVAATESYPDIIKGQVIDVLMTNYNERAMRNLYGANIQAALFDPGDELVRRDASNQVADALKSMAPRAVIRGVAFNIAPLRPGVVYVDVSYSAGVFDEARSIRLPTSWFLSEDTEL